MAAQEPQGPSRVAPVLERNIKTLMQRRSREMRLAPLPERIAAAVAGFLESMWSVAVHATVFGAWVLANLAAFPGILPWDPTFVVLGMTASVEAGSWSSRPGSQSTWGGRFAVRRCRASDAGDRARRGSRRDQAPQVRCRVSIGAVRYPPRTRSWTKRSFSIVGGVRAKG
jgi:hypothetical protein